MKRRIFTALLGGILFSFSYSQSLMDIAQKGNKVFIEFVDKSNEIIDHDAPLMAELKEWGYWKIVTSKDKSDFLIKKENSKGKQK